MSTGVGTRPEAVPAEVFQCTSLKQQAFVFSNSSGCSIFAADNPSGTTAKENLAAQAREHAPLGVGSTISGGGNDRTVPGRRVAPKSTEMHNAIRRILTFCRTIWAMRTAQKLTDLIGPTQIQPSAEYRRLGRRGARHGLFAFRGSVYC